MANVIEERGLFWWFKQADGQTNTKETSVSGALTITEEGHITLVLDGSLWYAQPPDPLPWGEPRPLPPHKWVTGLLASAGEIGQNGGHVLLCRLERTELPLEGEPQSYAASICITSDSPFSDGFDLANFDQLRIELLGLEDWLNLDSIHVEFEAIREDDVEVTVRYKNHRFLYDKPDASISIESLTLGAPFFSFSDLPQRAASFRQTYYLIYTTSATSTFDSLRYTFSQIEEFFALLLGSYFRLDWPTMVQRRDEFEPWYRTYYLRGRPSEFKVNHYFEWTNFPALQESFGDLLCNWQAQVEQYGAGYYLYLATLRNPHPYREDSFVNLIWALESLHRKKKRSEQIDASALERKTRIASIREKLALADDPTDLHWFEDRAPHHERSPNLSDRIFNLLSQLPLAIDEKALRRFSMRCAERRNDISHEGGPRQHETYLEFLGEVSNLNEALSYLYHALILHEIGLDEKLLVRAMTKGGLGESRILPALLRVGIEIPNAAEPQ